MNYPNLQVEVADNGVATVTIDRPEVRNAVNTETLVSLTGAFRDLSENEDVRAIVLRGAGEKAFCAGADLKEWQDREGASGYRAHFEAVARSVEAITRSPKPVVAAVDGYALAGGCGLAVACDITLASERSAFGLPEIRIGLLPAIVMAPIFRAIGRKKGVEMVLRGNRLKAVEAEACGLITRCVADDKIHEEAQALAAELASFSPFAMKLGKEAIATLGDMEFYASLNYLREVIALTSLSEDAAEGVAAFFEKRDPSWKGR